MKWREESLALSVPISVLVIALVSAWAAPADFEDRLRFLLGQGGKPSVLRLSAEQQAWGSGPQADAQPNSARCGAGQHQPLAFPRNTNWASLELADYLNSSSAEEVALVYQQQLVSLLRRNGLEWLTAEVQANFGKLCTARPGAQVALVGNGPISPRQREEIARAGCIVRLNMVPNMLPHEPTDIWIVKGDKLGANVPWFVPGAANQTAPDAIHQMGRRVQGVVLADVFKRSSWHINWWRDPDPHVSQRWPWTSSVLAFVQYLGSGSAASREEALLPLELARFYEVWAALTARLGYTSFNLPSSGLLGALVVLSSLPKDGSLDVYGFNWSPQNWAGHPMAIENSLMRMMSVGYKGRVRLHDTPCNRLRSCD